MAKDGINAPHLSAEMTDIHHHAWLGSVLKIIYLQFGYIVFCLHVFGVCMTCVPTKARRMHYILWNWNFNYKLSCGSWELNLGPLQKQKVLFKNFFNFCFFWPWQSWNLPCRPGLEILTCLCLLVLGLKMCHESQATGSTLSYSSVQALGLSIKSPF